MYYRIKSFHAHTLRQKPNSVLILGKPKEKRISKRIKASFSTIAFCIFGTVLFIGLLIDIHYGWYVLLFRRIGSMTLCIFLFFLLTVGLIHCAVSLPCKELLVTISSVILIGIVLFSLIPFSNPVYYLSADQTQTIVQLGSTF